MEVRLEIRCESRGIELGLCMYVCAVEREREECLRIGKGIPIIMLMLEVIPLGIVLVGVTIKQGRGKYLECIQYQPALIQARSSCSHVHA